MLTLGTSWTDQLKRKECLRKTNSNSNKTVVLSQEFFLVAKAQTLRRISTKTLTDSLSSQMLETNFT